MPLLLPVRCLAADVGAFRVTGSGKKSWVFGLGAFSDWRLRHCQRSAGILGECCGFALLGLSGALGYFSPWSWSLSLLCPQVCFPGSAYSVSLVLPLVRSCPDLCQDSCPVVRTRNCFVPGAAFVSAMNHFSYQSLSCRVEHWAGMGMQTVLATEIK